MSKADYYSQPQFDNGWAEFALPVPCTRCAAARGDECNGTPDWGPRRFHKIRVNAGIRRAVRTDESWHELAVQGYRCAVAAIDDGQDPDPHHVNLALTCCCPDCLPLTVERVHILRPYMETPTRTTEKRNQ